MGIYEELQARGLIAQVTDEERIKELVNNGKVNSNVHLSAEGTFGKQNLRNRFDCAKMEPSFDRKRQKMTWTRG